MTHELPHDHENVTPTEQVLSPTAKVALGGLALRSTESQPTQPSPEAEPTTEQEAYNRLMNSFGTIINQQFWAVNRTLEARGEQPISPEDETDPRNDVAFSEVVGQALQEGSFPRIMPHMKDIRSTNTWMVHVSPGIQPTTIDGRATFNNNFGVISVSDTYGDETGVDQLASYPTNGIPSSKYPELALSVDGYNILRQQMDAEADRINQAFPDNPGNQAL